MCSAVLCGVVMCRKCGVVYQVLCVVRCGTVLKIAV